MGLYASRHTFVIGKDGRVLDIDLDVNPGSSGADLVARLERLGIPRIAHPQP